MIYALGNRNDQINIKMIQILEILGIRMYG